MTHPSTFFRDEFKWISSFREIARSKGNYATVSKATQLGETFDLEDLVIHNDETGSSFKGHITAHWNEYTLTVVDRWGNEDESFPPLPGVRSKGQYKAGAFVAVAMAYGDSPAIIGEVQL